MLCMYVCMCVCVNRVYYDVLCVHVHDMGLVGLNSKNLVPLRLLLRRVVGGMAHVRRRLVGRSERRIEKLLGNYVKEDGICGGASRLEGLSFFGYPLPL